MKHIKLFEEYKYFKGRKTRTHRLPYDNKYDKDGKLLPIDNYNKTKPAGRSDNVKDPNEPFFSWNKKKYNNKKDADNFVTRINSESDERKKKRKKDEELKNAELLELFGLTINDIKTALGSDKVDENDITVTNNKTYSILNIRTYRGWGSKGYTIYKIEDDYYILKYYTDPSPNSRRFGEQIYPPLQDRSDAKETRVKSDRLDKIFNYIKELTLKREMKHKEDSTRELRRFDKEI